jgi:hypothetical protein
VSVDAANSGGTLRPVDVVQIAEYKIALIVHGESGDVKVLIRGDQADGSWTVKSDTRAAQDEMYSAVLSRTLSVPALICLIFQQLK